MRSRRSGTPRGDHCRWPPNHPPAAVSTCITPRFRVVGVPAPTRKRDGARLLGPALLFARRESVRVVDRPVLGRDRPAGSLGGAIAGTAAVLAGRAIRSDLQAHLTVARPAKPPGARRRTPLPVRTNLATLVTSIFPLHFSRKSCPTTTFDFAMVGRVVRVVGPEGVDGAGVVAAGGFPMDARPGT